MSKSSTMRRISIVLVLALVAPVLGLPAGAEEVATPDGRARLEVTPEAGPDGVRVEGGGDAGAVGFRGAVDAGPDHLRVEDPPMYGAIEFTPEGQRNHYEELFGPRLANVTIGTGRLTAGLQRTGRLTNLNWPDVGGYDHVNAVNVSRRWDGHGAPENAGAFGGVVLTTGEVTWLNPGFGWEVVSQTYGGTENQTVVTVLRKELDDPRSQPGGPRHLTATITDVVHPTEDVLARRFRFSPPHLVASFVHYANMNPATSRAPRTPSVFDGLADNASDFATVYLAGSDDTTEDGTPEDGTPPDGVPDDAMLHFRPYTADSAAASRLVTSYPDAENTPEAVGDTFGTGVYIAVGGAARATDHQAGLETVGLVRDEADGTGAIDPFYDLLADGELSGSPAAAGKTAGAIELPRDIGNAYTVYLTAAADPETATGQLQRARAQGFGDIEAASEDFWADWLDGARLPASGDERTVQVARRALMLIRTAQAPSGAIVANATSQTPYRQDWVRDGAFFNYALLLAGYPEMVLEHNAFYREVYRPGGTWDSFYFTDGAESGFVFPYEIDSQAFALWALWLPYAFAQQDERTADALPSDYLERTYPAIRETADAIMLCHDPTNGMQCYAPEDDAYQPTQGPQGASTVYLALRSAADAARALDHPEDAARWDARATELRDAAIDGLCGADGTCGRGRGGKYMAWPSYLIPDAIAAREDLTPSLLQTHLDQFVDTMDDRASRRMPVGGHFQYPMESILPLAPLWEDADRDERLDGWIRWLTHDVAEPEVLHYGERIFWCGTPGTPDHDGSVCRPEQEYLHAVGFPHIWSGTEMYLAAAFVDGVTGCPAGTSRVGEAPCA